MASCFETPHKAACQSLTEKVTNEMARYGKCRHARPRAGHPRSQRQHARKTWMAGSPVYA